MGKICSHVGKYKFYRNSKENENISHWEMFNSRPSRPKDRVKVKCPECKRRVYGQLKYCHDGCCVFIRVPPHKKRMWWKRK